MLSFFVTIIKTLPEPELNALQISLNHIESCRGSVDRHVSHSAIQPTPGFTDMSLYPLRYYIFIGVGRGLCLVIEDDNVWIFPSVACVMLLPKVGSCCPPFKSQPRGQLFENKVCFRSDANNRGKVGLLSKGCLISTTDTQWVRSL